MGAIVIDAGVLAVALVDDGSLGSLIRSRLLGSELFAPEIIDLEVANVVRKHVIAGRLSSDRARQAIDDLVNLPLTRLSHRPLLPRIWELHPNVASYDAAYVASAEILQAPLATADTKLTKAPGTRCQFEIVN